MPTNPEILFLERLLINMLGEEPLLNNSATTLSALIPNLMRYQAASIQNIYQ